jgi:hypothetical protein
MPDDIRLDLEIVEVDGRDAVLLGQKRGEFFLLDETEAHQTGTEPAPVELLVVQCLVQLLGIYQIVANQQFAKTVTCHEKIL